MEAPEKLLVELSGVSGVAVEELSDAPECKRVCFSMEREKINCRQRVLFLRLPAGGGYGLVPVSAFDATGVRSARLTEIYEGWKTKEDTEDAGELVGAINGGYFIFIERLWSRASRFYAEHTRVGDPIGLLMTEGSVKSPPLYGRAAVIVDDEGRMNISRAEMTDVKISFVNSAGARAEFHPEAINVNDPGHVVVFTPAWKDKDTPRDKGAMDAAVICNTVAAAGSGGGISIPVNGFVLSAPISAWNGITGRELRKNDVTVTIEISDKGKGRHGRVRHALEAGPALVRGGEPHDVDVEFLNMQGFVQGTPPFPAFNSVLTHYRLPAPRMCLGLTESGDVLIALFEGRMPDESDGVTLNEAARVMAAVGCREAVNLDGGASAEIILGGKSLNTPQLGGDKKWLDRGLDFLTKYMRAGTLPTSEALGGGDERTIGSALMIVRG